jgi:hypothetical protein
MKGKVHESYTNITLKKILMLCRLTSSTLHQADHYVQCNKSTKKYILST